MRPAGTSANRATWLWSRASTRTWPDSLRRRGHTLLVDPATVLFGGAQAIFKLPGGYVAASDPRKDGQAVAS